jgi:hypothetical protein
MARQLGSATVPAIGCDIAKSRRADSGDPAGIGADRCVDSRSGSSRGRLRKRRASSATSRKLTRPQLSRMTSRRSPCSPEAASVHFPAAPLPDSCPLSRTRAARRVADVADQPISSLSATVGKVAPAHRRGIARETLRQFGCVARHLRRPRGSRCARWGSVPAPSPEWRRRWRRSARTSEASMR